MRRRRPASRAHAAARRRARADRSAARAGAGFVVAGRARRSSNSPARSLLVVFLAYYLLCSGDLYKRKIVKHVPSLTRKKITVEILNDIDRQIERFPGHAHHRQRHRRRLDGAGAVADRAAASRRSGASPPALLNIFPYVGPVGGDDRGRRGRISSSSARSRW